MTDILPPDLAQRLLRTLDWLYYPQQPFCGCLQCRLSRWRLRLRDRPVPPTEADKKAMSELRIRWFGQDFMAPDETK